MDHLQLQEHMHWVRDHCVFVFVAGSLQNLHLNAAVYLNLISKSSGVYHPSASIIFGYQGCQTQAVEPTLLPVELNRFFGGQVPFAAWFSAWCVRCCLVSLTWCKKLLSFLSINSFTINYLFLLLLWAFFYSVNKTDATSDCFQWNQKQIKEK